MPNNGTLDQVRQRLADAGAEHKRKRKLDSFLYNGGTAAVLFATAAASLLGTDAVQPWVPRALSGFAAFWIALERALSFGHRWRFHLEMEQGYRSAVDMIDFHPDLPSSEHDRWRQRIWEAILSLRGREANIPGGAGAITDAATTGSA